MIISRRWFLLLVSAAIFCAPALAAEQADRIWTGESFLTIVDANPRVEAVAVA